MSFYGIILSVYPKEMSLAGIPNMVPVGDTPSMAHFLVLSRCLQKVGGVMWGFRPAGLLFGHWADFLKKRFGGNCTTAEGS